MLLCWMQKAMSGRRDLRGSRVYGLGFRGQGLGFKGFGRGLGLKGFLGGGLGFRVWG